MEGRDTFWNTELTGAIEGGEELLDAGGTEDAEALYPSWAEVCCVSGLDSVMEVERLKPARGILHLWHDFVM